MHYIKKLDNMEGNVNKYCKKEMEQITKQYIDNKNTNSINMLNYASNFNELIKKFGMRQWKKIFTIKCEKMFCNPNKNMIEWFNKTYVSNNKHYYNNITHIIKKHLIFIINNKDKICYTILDVSNYVTYINILIKFNIQCDNNLREVLINDLINRNIILSIKDV